jgi:iron complex outermembrane receptor protein
VATPQAHRATFSMRGFSGTQINTLYNGIKIGPSEMTSRIMDLGNLDRVEVLKGPASLLSGEGATAGAVNYVTKAPHTGPVVNELYGSWDSYNGYRANFGSGGSTAIKGLDYRFDVTRSSINSSIDDTYTKIWNISGGLNYRVTNDLRVWIAAEHKEDKDRFYWGTPLVPANFPGIVPTRGVVSGRWTQYYPGPDFEGHVSPLNPVTVDARTLKTTYNVLDNRSGAQENWLRGGFEYAANNNVTFKSQFYGYNAKRHWFNNEINAFNDSGPTVAGDVGQVFRERLSVDHDQKLFGTINDVVMNSNISGMDNRAVLTFAASTLQFNVTQDDFFFEDAVNLVNPARGFYGPQKTKPFFTQLDNYSLAFEDRLKLTPTFALVGGVRGESINLNRTAFDVNGVLRGADGYPLEKTFSPVTGRIGYSWDLFPGFTFYSQYATAADPAVANIFILRPTQPLLLTESRTYETGVKHLFWANRAEWAFSAFDIERNNVYQSKSGHLVNVAGSVHAKGVEINGAVRPTDEWKLFANAAFVESKYENFRDNFTGEDFSGKTPPNVPRVVVNAGPSYRFAFRWPVEVGGLVRHVGNRFNNDDNLVVMDLLHDRGRVCLGRYRQEGPGLALAGHQSGPGDVPRPQRWRQGVRGMGRSRLSRPSHSRPAANLRRLGRHQILMSDFATTNGIARVIPRLRNLTRHARA